MEARFYLQPLFREGEYLNEMDITDYVLNSSIIVQRPERNKWTYGIVSAGEVRLTLRDDGRFGPRSSSGSLFSYYGRDHARLRIAYPSVRAGAPDITVWRGFTTGKDTSSSIDQGTTSLFARTLDSVLIDEVISAGNIVNGLTIPEIVSRIFNEAPVADALPGSLLLDLHDPVQGGLTLANGNELLGDDRRASEALQQILAVSDGLLSYDFHIQRPIVFSRGDLGLNSYPEETLNDALDIKMIEDGSEGVRNQFIITTGLEGRDAKIVIESEPSIHTHGLREVELDCSWIGDREACVQIGEYLRSRLSAPRESVKLSLTAWQLPPEKTAVGQRVAVDIAPGTPLDEPGYGTGNYGAARYQSVRHDRVQGSFWIEEVSREVMTDTVTVSMRRRVQV